MNRLTSNKTIKCNFDKDKSYLTSNNKNYYKVGEKYYRSIKYDDTISTIDLEHIYTCTQVELLYDFIPLGVMQTKDKNKDFFENGCLYGFHKKSDIDKLIQPKYEQLTLF